VRRVPIRLKLAGALVLPLIGLLSVTWSEVRAISREVTDAKAQADLAEASLGPSSLITALQQERAAAAVQLIGMEQDFALETGYADSRDFMDAAIEDTRAWLDEDHEGELARAYTPSLDALDELEAIRADVDAVPVENRSLVNAMYSGEIFDRYSMLMSQLFDANREIAFSIDDDVLRRGVDLYSLTARQTDTLALLVKDLMIPGALQQALEDPALVRPVARELAMLRDTEQAIRTKAQGDYAPLADRLFATDHIVALPQLADDALDTGTIDLVGVVENSLGTDPETFGYLVFRDEVQAEIVDRAGTIKADADARLLRYLILSSVASALAVGATWLVSLSITRPLRSLNGQARDLAENRLPVAVRDILETPLGDDVSVPSPRPIVVKSRDEVGDVVTALNTVQESALDLAVEQAVLRRNLADSFVNLGRRNQNLLSRQLDFITVLESSEAEPQILASLFRLDHLATRMRRNAESLLVLAGIDPPRKWSAPLRLNDVVRAALGEVEDYHRVVARDLGPVTVVGSLGADLAHLLAELVENALTFSPPDEEVEVRGRARQDGGYSLAVLDTGPGMPDHQLVAANRRLAGHESFTVAPSKYLGHYVAGHLADRHGIDLRLEPRPHSGIAAVIDLPPSALVATSAPSLPAALSSPDPAPAPPPAPAAPVRAAALAGAAAPGGPPMVAAAPAPAPVPTPPAVPSSVPPAGPTAPLRPLPTDAPAPPATPAGPDIAHLAVLAGRLPPVHPDAPWGAQVPASEPPGAQPAPEASPPLARRRRGANLPSGNVGSLRRSDPGAVTLPRSAEDVHQFIASFAAGVRQGHARARAPRPD
jgi:signal transduction histidine kinase